MEISTILIIKSFLVLGALLSVVAGEPGFIKITRKTGVHLISIECNKDKMRLVTVLVDIPFCTCLDDYFLHLDTVSDPDSARCTPCLVCKNKKWTPHEIVACKPYTDTLCCEKPNMVANMTAYGYEECTMPPQGETAPKTSKSPEAPPNKKPDIDDEKEHRDHDVIGKGRKGDNQEEESPGGKDGGGQSTEDTHNPNEHNCSSSSESSDDQHKDTIVEAVLGGMIQGAALALVLVAIFYKRSWIYDKLSCWNQHLRTQAAEASDGHLLDGEVEQQDGANSSRQEEL